MSEVRDVTTWYLEMLSVGQLRPARIPTAPHRVEHVVAPSAEYARYLYTAVGGGYQWTDRLPWSKARWEAHLSRDAVQLHTLHIDGAPAGFVELEWQPPGDVQLIYFGLMARYLGQGWGGHFLTRAVQLAWQLGDARRVWVHTCTLDAPSAYANYRARGFVTFREKTESVELGPTPGPWPGWDHEPSPE